MKTICTIKAGDSTRTPDDSGHGVDNSAGAEDLVFMALIVTSKFDGT